MIKELTRRLREADAMIEHLQSQHKPLQTQQTNTQLELSNALAGEAQAKLAVEKMEHEIEDLLVPSLAELKALREQMLMERAVSKHSIDELTEHNEQAVVRETRQTAEFQALQETLDEERSSYTVSIDQLKKKVEEMASIMEKTLERNNVLEEQLASASEEKNTLSVANHDLKEQADQSTAEAGDLKHREEKAYVDRARSMADMESIVFSLQRELQESRAGELALESQLQAVKVSITRVSPEQAGHLAALSPPRSKSPAKAPKSPPKPLPPPAATPEPAPQPARVVPEMPPLNLQYRSSPERPPAAAAYVPYEPKYELPKHELPKYPADFAHHKTDSSALAHHTAPLYDLDELSKKLEAFGAVPHHNPTPSASYGGATSAGQTGQYQYQAPAFTGSYGQTQQVQSSYPYPAQTQNTGFAHRYPELARHL